MREKLTARPWLTVALTAILAAAMGFAIAVLAVRDIPPGEDSAEVGFARDMALHHSQAVDMSMFLVEDGQDEQLGYIAYDMALTQQGQIGTMNSWLDDWDVKATSTTHMEWMASEAHSGHNNSGGVMPGMATQQQLDELMDSSGTTADIMYCELMITHHMAGVTMAEAILERTDLPQVERMAEAMVRGQEAEINVLTEIQERLENDA